MHRYMLLIAVSLALCLSVESSAQTCDSLSFGVSAVLSNDAGFEGMYKYTISGYWEVSGVEEGGGLSNLLFSLGASCPCLCDSTSQVISFPDPAGTSTGVDNNTEEPCELGYLGFIECNGLEDITTDVVVKFEVPDNVPCEPIQSGTGTWIFYSTLPPMNWNQYSGAVTLKYGEMLCSGDLSGQLPFCHDCIPVQTEERTWGAIKSLYWR
jgi:hypothetical protein